MRIRWLFMGKGVAVVAFEGVHDALFEVHAPLLVQQVEGDLQGHGLGVTQADADDMGDAAQKTQVRGHQKLLVRSSTARIPSQTPSQTMGQQMNAWEPISRPKERLRADSCRE
jgi:hypothetical protein